MQRRDLRVDHVHYCRPVFGGELLKIISEAKENGLRIKWHGGSFPAKSEGADILISLECMKKIVFCDPEEEIFTFEAGVTIDEILHCLECMNFTLQIYGIIPNLAVSDAIAVGLTGSNGTIAQCLKSCQVLHPNGNVVECGWPETDEIVNKNVPQDSNFIQPTLQTLVCGLGIVGIVTAATFKCIPMHLAQEVTFACPLEEVTNNWQKLSECLYSYVNWYPLLDKVIVTKASSVRLHLAHQQPTWKKCAETFFWCMHWVVNRLSPFLSWYVPSLTKQLSKLQFNLVMRAASYRMQYSFKPQTLVSVESHCRGIMWSLPANKLQEITEEIGYWAEDRFSLCSTPITIAFQTHHSSSLHYPFLSPYSEVKTCTLWTDWFNSDSITKTFSATMAEFEALLQKNGGRKCWSAGPVYASHLIGQIYPGFKYWSKARATIDPSVMLQSAYVTGDIFLEKEERMRQKKNSFRKMAVEFGVHHIKRNTGVFLFRILAQTRGLCSKEKCKDLLSAFFIQACDQILEKHVSASVPSYLSSHQHGHFE